MTLPLPIDAPLPGDEKPRRLIYVPQDGIRVKPWRCRMATRNIGVVVYAHGKAARQILYDLREWRWLARKAPIWIDKAK